MLGLGADGKTAHNLLARPDMVINLPAAHQWEAVERLAPLTGLYPVPAGKRARFRYEPAKFTARPLGRSGRGQESGTTQRLHFGRFVKRVILDDVIHTDYGQFDLLWSSEGVGFDGDWDRVFQGHVNGLVGAADDGGVYFNLARRSGGSRVRVVQLDAERPLPTAKCEDVVEVSVTVPSGAVVI